MSKALRIIHAPFGRVALLTLEQNLIAHAHRHCHVLLKYAGADISFGVGEAEYTLDDETALLINSCEPHWYHHRPVATPIVMVALYIAPRWLAGIDRRLLCSVHPRFFAESRVALSGPARRASAALAEILTYEPAPDPDTVDSLVFDLLVALVERFAPWRALDRRGIVGITGDARIRKVLAHLGQAIGGAAPSAAIDGAQLAHLAGLSRARFFELFKQQTGLTPITFVNMLRMEAAIGELVAGERPLGDIANRLGFDCSANFTRFFRSQLGIAPSHYRRVAEVLGPAHYAQ